MREQFETISLDELSVLEISCKCGTSMVLRMAEGNLYPVRCPTCQDRRDPYVDRLDRALASYRTFCKEMKELGLKAGFRINRTPAQN